MENSFPRGEGDPEGVGRGMRAKIYKSEQHNGPAQGLEIVPLSRSFRFLSSGVTARIPLQSWKSLWAISMTAWNCGVIAPGNHWISDSLRGAPPRGKRLGAPAPVRYTKKCPSRFREGQTLWVQKLGCAPGTALNKTPRQARCRSTRVLLDFRQATFWTVWVRALPG